MQTIFTLLTSNANINLPDDLIGWVGWLILAAAVVWGIVKQRRSLRGQTNRRWVILIVLLAVAPLAALFLGVRLPEIDTLPLPGLPSVPNPPALMFLAAVPFVLAAGFLGAVQAAIVGAFTGLFLATWGTHSSFTPLEMAGLALLFGMAVRQRYRTWFYRWMRHPLAAALTLAVAYVPVLITTSFFGTRASTAARLDFAFTQTWNVILVQGGQLLVAGLIAEVLYLARVPGWGGTGGLIPSPTEQHLEKRFLYGALPLLGATILTLMLSDWMVAGQAAQKMFESRLGSTARVAAESLPYFLETGQNLILNIADPQLMALPADQVSAVLSTRLRIVPYFRQLYLLNASGQPVSGYPVSAFDQIRPSQDEFTGIQLALRGVPVQTYTVAPWPGETTAQISFIASIRDAQENVLGVLIGRTDLNYNPFTQPSIQALQTIKETGGEGVILDENQQVLYHSQDSASLIMTPYIGRIPEEAGFFSETAPDGTRRLVYYQPALGRPWGVVLSVPAARAQEYALSIAVPLLVLVVALAVFALLALRFSLRRVTSSLGDLAQESTLISRGQLDHPLQPRGVDEVGQVSTSFEQMRQALQARMDEMNRLLAATQGVAATLEIEQAVQPVLKAALTHQASAARVVLGGDVTMDAVNNPTVAYGQGASSEQYAYLDAQIYPLMRDQEQLSIPNTARIRRLNIPVDSPRPGALLALPLRHENVYFGALWVAFDQPYNFSEELLRFLSTLAGEAALAAANARLYTGAEIGRQRLEAVLDSTSEPVLVIDERRQLLLSNPAALQVPGLLASAVPGRPVQEVVLQPDLKNLLVEPSELASASREISLANGRIYFASISPVMADGRPVGKVCILRDVTTYKELDSLKSEFVSTVSHDLRSPLTLMRGYTTMLSMVGELNEQQKSYINKIAVGVENMTRLVNNLLDLGRIEAGVGLKLGPTALDEIINHVLNQLGPQAAQKNIKVEGFLPEKLPVSMEADRELLQQAVYNLVENAIKYTNVNGRVTVRLEERADSASVEVSDNGIGIAPLDLPHMFEKFYRSGRREAYQQRGTGLGLAIVKSIAERHGGRVWVDSQLGKGSTFFLLIPLKRENPVKS